MATNLTPEQLAALNAQWQQYANSGYGNGSLLNYTDPTGGTYHITTSSSGGGAEQGGPDVFATGYVGDQVAGRNQAGDVQQMYDLYGRYLGSGVIPKDTSFQEFLLLGAGLATAGTLTAMGAGGAAAGTAAGVAGPGDAGWGMSLDSVTGGSGSELLGAGAWNTAPAGGSYLQGTSAGMGAPAASNAAFNSAMSGGSSLPSLLTGGSGLTAATKGLLGAGATLLGGALGAQGTQKEQTLQKDIPEWLKPYVLGDTGLLSKTNSLLQQQTQPGALAGFDLMKQQGMSLLNQPIRPNGFSLFTGR